MSSITGQTWNTDAYATNGRFVATLASAVVELLAPTAGERVLDLGCGHGALTEQIAATGALVTGVDNSPAMLEAARKRDLQVEQHSADELPYNLQFDAVFSNAALHWVREAESAIACMSRAVRSGGRLVLEMGGQGNIARIMRGTEEVLREAGFEASHTWYFPSIGEYTTLLEKHGFAVRLAQNFARWTQLEHPERGLREWLEMFGGAYFENVPPAKRDELVRRIEARLKPELWCDGSWFADYRRLRVVAERD